MRIWPLVLVMGCGGAQSTEVSDAIQSEPVVVQSADPVAEPPPSEPLRCEELPQALALLRAPPGLSGDVEDLEVVRARDGGPDVGDVVHATLEVGTVTNDPLPDYVASIHSRRGRPRCNGLAECEITVLVGCDDLLAELRAPERYTYFQPIASFVERDGRRWHDLGWSRRGVPRRLEIESEMEGRVPGEAGLLRLGDESYRPAPDDALSALAEGCRAREDERWCADAAALATTLAERGQARFRAARSIEARGDVVEATAWILRAVEDLPDDPDVAGMAARLARQRCEALSESIDEEPEASSLMCARSLECAIDDPGRAAVLLIIAEGQVAQDRLSAARRTLQRAQRLQPDDAEIQARLEALE